MEAIRRALSTVREEMDVRQELLYLTGALTLRLLTWIVQCLTG